MNEWPDTVGNHCPACDADRRYIELHRCVEFPNTIFYELGCNQCGHSWAEVEPDHHDNKESAK